LRKSLEIRYIFFLDHFFSVRYNCLSYNKIVAKTIIYDIIDGLLIKTLPRRYKIIRLQLKSHKKL